VVIAAESTKFQVTESTLGVPAAGFWSQIASATGAAFATDVVLTGRFFTAAEAHSAGLIARVVPDGEHLNEAKRVADQILGNPQLALRESVRYRRSVISEASHHSQMVAGNFKWQETESFKKTIRAKNFA
jgi:enoyl-CoA hydratase/carnithine racemase